MFEYGINVILLSLIIQQLSLMIDVIKIASYIFKRYEEEMCTKIDEMKLHKLLYFAQRESIIQTGEPMFEAQFAAWKYGPVIVGIRNSYKLNLLTFLPSEEELSPYKSSLDYIFQNYATKDSWTLSMLTHGESCWLNARKGYGQDEHCDVLINLSDIAKDAERMKVRRFYFENIAPKLQ